MAATPAAPGPCAGLRVLDFSTVVSGPLCTQILGDLGADVIKVEAPGGDVCRLMGPPFREGGLSGFFVQVNRNKRSLVLDLRHPDGPGLARRLARGCDVLVQNFRPGVADRLGIGAEVLRAQEPRLVYVSISGFGPDGPYAGHPAYDLVIQGLVGAMPIQGGDGPPAMMKSLVADKCTALTAASATLAALLARERNGGAGQHVEVPMLDAFAAYLLPDLLIQEAFQPKDPNPGPRLDIHRTWQTADGHVVGIVIEDSQFEGVCRALERMDLHADERFGGFPGRIAHATELFGELEAELRKWPTREFVERARRFGAPFAPANDLGEFLADPQVRHNGTWQDHEAPGVGSIRYLRHPVRYETTPASLRRHPPRLGQHTDEVLAEAGLGSGEIEAARSSGVIA